MEWRIECYFDGHMSIFKLATTRKSGHYDYARGNLLKLLVLIACPGDMVSWSSGTSFSNIAI